MTKEKTIWADVVCGLAVNSDCVHQADNGLLAMRLQSLCQISDTLILPYMLSLCLACGQARSVLHAANVRCTHTLDWTGWVWLDCAATPVGPQGLGRFTSWGTSYKVERDNKATPSLKCSNLVKLQWVNYKTHRSDKNIHCLRKKKK